MRTYVCTVKENSSSNKQASRAAVITLSAFTMLSLLFGKKNKVSTGTGYGGHVVNDEKKLKKGREKAATLESSRDQHKLTFLIAIGPMLRNKALDKGTTTKLVSTLKDVFLNQTPREWTKRKKLLLVSLTCFSLMLQNYKDLVGDTQNAESLAAAFHQLAQHAHFFNKHNNGKEHARMVTKILEIQSTMQMTSGDARNNNGILEEKDPRLLYRKTLSPLSFDFCDSLKNHSFASQSQSNNLNMRTLFQELSAFQSSLPVEYGSSIFVRAVEGRLDLLRALIIGPEDTPYANGCFLFDIWLNDYPNKPPKVKFLTTGGGKVTFNPNLYSNGKVCLSLLGTWDGPGWIKGESTLLQVLVSIQSLIFVGEPLYNEPLAGMLRGWNVLKQRSVAYNANIRRHVLRHAILPYIHGSSLLYPEFHDVMQQHYRIKKQQVQQQATQWAKDDESLSGLVEQVLTKLSRRSKVDKARKVNDGNNKPPLHKRQKRDQSPVAR